MHGNEYDAVKLDLLSKDGGLKASAVDGYRSRQASVSDKYFVLLRDDTGVLDVMPSDVLKIANQSLQVSAVSSNCTVFAEWPHHDIEAIEIPAIEITPGAANNFLDLGKGRANFYRVEMNLWAGAESLPTEKLSEFLDHSSARQYFNSLKRDAAQEAKRRDRRATRCEVLLRKSNETLDRFDVPKI